MTIEAQNALLKTLEEPPEYAIIILITSNKESLLDTIKSRCEIIKFLPISIVDLNNYLITKIMYVNLIMYFHSSFMEISENGYLR